MYQPIGKNISIAGGPRVHQKQLVYLLFRRRQIIFFELSKILFTDREYVKFARSSNIEYTRNDLEVSIDMRV
jgi:hypothetical protein